ncbi:MAG: serine/threonine-protein kinase [Myxococcota bacterium]
MLAGYRVTQLLGRGGMGEVWAGTDSTGAQVAIKVLLPSVALQPDAVARFKREAHVSAAISSPHVCRLVEHTNDPETGSNVLVFERLVGETLAERLERDGYLSFAEVGWILSDALRGLVDAHACGVIHRDLKPSNLFIEWLGRPERPERAKVLDFGISKRTEHRDDEPSLTDFGQTLGSVTYMAPEQIRAAATVDERADVYGIGAVAFRALSGRLPFEAQNIGILVALKLDRPAPTLAEVTQDQWPRRLEEFLATALAGKPEDRFASAQEAFEAWQAILPQGVIHREQRPPERSAAAFDDDQTVMESPVTHESETTDRKWPGDIWDGGPTEGG